MCSLRPDCKFQCDLTNSLFKKNLFSSSEQDSKGEETEKTNEEGEAPKESEAVTPTAAAEGNEETAASEEKEGGQGNEEEAVAQDDNADEKDEGMTQLSRDRLIICGLMPISCLFSQYGYCLHQKETLFLLWLFSISDIQIGVRGRLRVLVLSSEHANFEIFHPPNPTARAQYGKHVLLVVLVLQSEGRYQFKPC